MRSPNDKIRHRAEFLARRCDGHEVRSVIITMLYDMEIPLNNCGFSYLKDAVEVAFSRRSVVVVKEIFDEVGEMYVPSVEYSAMDSGIRGVVQKAWYNRKNDRWDYYFPEYILSRKHPPSNAEVLTAMVYFLDMWQSCCKGGVKSAGK